MMHWRVFALVSASAVLVGGLYAQVRQIDYSQRKSSFEGKSFETTSTSPAANQLWQNKKFETAKFTTREYRRADSKFAVEKMDLFSSKKFETPKLDFQVREKVFHRNDRGRSNSDSRFAAEDLESVLFNTLHHSSKKTSSVIDQSGEIKVDDVLDKLSLADLNRYQFRRSHSTEEGLPVQTAGGPTPEADVEK